MAEYQFCTLVMVIRFHHGAPLTLSKKIIMWKLKLKLLIKSGKSKEDAMMQLLEEYDIQVKKMDATLALCVEKLSQPDIQEIFQFEKSK